MNSTPRDHIARDPDYDDTSQGTPNNTNSSVGSSEDPVRRIGSWGIYGTSSSKHKMSRDDAENLIKDQCQYKLRDKKHRVTVKPQTALKKRKVDECKWLQPGLTQTQVAPYRSGPEALSWRYCHKPTYLYTKAHMWKTQPAEEACPRYPRCPKRAFVLSERDRLNPVDGTADSPQP